MAAPRLSSLEYRIMEVLWDRGEASIREVCDEMAARAGRKSAPAYTTVQTTIYRMETKGVVTRLKRVGNFHVFAPAITRDAAQRTLIDELLGLFGGKATPVMAHLVETGKLSLEDVKEAERSLEKMRKKGKKA